MTYTTIRDNVVGVLFGMLFGLVGAAVMQWWLNRRDVNGNV